MTLRVKQSRVVLVDQDGAPCGVVDDVEVARDVVDSDASRWDHVVDYHHGVSHFEEVEAK